MSLFKTMNALDTLGVRDDYLADREAREMAKLNLSLIKANRLEARQVKAEKRAERADERSARSEERSIISHEQAKEAHEWRQDTQRKQDILDIFTPYQNALASGNLTLEGLEGVGGEKSIKEGDSDEVKDAKRGWQGTFNIELANALEKYKDDPEALKQVKLVGENVQQAYDITHKFEKDEEQLLLTIEELNNSHKEGSTANAASVRKLLTNIQNKHRLYIESSGVNKPLETAWENVTKEAETQSYVYNTLEQYTNASFDGKKINMLTENIDIFQDMVLPDDATEEQKIALRESRNFRDKNPRQYNKLKSAEYNASIGNFPEAERLLQSLHGDFVGDIGIEGRKASAEAKTTKAIMEEAEDQIRKSILSHTARIQVPVDDVTTGMQTDDGGALNVYYESLSLFEGGISKIDTKTNWNTGMASETIADLYQGVLDAQVQEEDKGGKVFGGQWGVNIFGDYEEHLKTEARNNPLTAALLQSGWVRTAEIKDETGRENTALVWNVTGRNVPKDQKYLVYSQYDAEEKSWVVKNPLQSLKYKIDNKRRRESIKEFTYADRDVWGTGDNSTLQNAMANAAMVYIKSRPGYVDAQNVVPEFDEEKRLIQDAPKLAANDDIRKQIASATKDGVFDATERKDLVESFEKINESDATKVLKLLEEEGLLNAEDRQKFQKTWNDWAGKSAEERKSMMGVLKKQTEEENQITILDKSSERRDFRRKYGNKMTPAERNKFSEDGIIPTRFIDIYNKER